MPKTVQSNRASHVGISSAFTCAIRADTILQAPQDTNNNDTGSVCIGMIPDMPRHEPESRLRADSSTLLLILANIVPLYGVFAWDWKVFALVFLFWFENVVVGIFNAARILAARPDKPLVWFRKLFLVAFFCIHYGIFTAVHGLFVMTLFGDYAETLNHPPGLGQILHVIRDQNLFWPVLALFLSHGYSFVVNYLGRGEYRNVSPRALMSRPYRRIMILHITIIAGGALVMAMKAPVLGLIFLIALKTGIDVYTHMATHGREQPDPLD